MTTVEIEDDKVLVTMKGLHRVWSLKSRLRIPLVHVTGARVDPGIERERRWRDLRVGGTWLPGVIQAGRVRERGEWAFWDVHDSRKAIVIELVDEDYSRLVLEVEDPATTVAVIEGAIGRA